MAIIKLPFNDLVASLGATHHWPLDTTNPLGDEILGGTDDLSVSKIDGDMTPQDGLLLPESSVKYANLDHNGWALTMPDLATHCSNQGVTEYTILFFSTKAYSVFSMDGAGSSNVTNESLRMYSFRVHPDGTYQRHTNKNSGTRSTDTVDPTVDGFNSGLINVYYSGGAEIGHIVFFPKALTEDELATIYEQRLFTGKISGTATVDGAGEQVRVRAFERSGSRLVGETTAAADGSYEIWVTNPSEVDLLATPPEGVAARPLAHGPITPIDVNG